MRVAAKPGAHRPSPGAVPARKRRITPLTSPSTSAIWPYKSATQHAVTVCHRSRARRNGPRAHTHMFASVPAPSPAAAPAMSTNSGCKHPGAETAFRVALQKFALAAHTLAARLEPSSRRRSREDEGEITQSCCSRLAPVATSSPTTPHSVREVGPCQIQSTE